MKHLARLNMEYVVLTCKRCGHEWTPERNYYRVISCPKCGLSAQYYKTLFQKFEIKIASTSGDVKVVKSPEELKNLLVLEKEVIKMQEQGEKNQGLVAGKETVKADEEFEDAVAESDERSVYIRKRIRLSPRLLLCYLYYIYKTGEKISFDYFINKMALEACEKLYGIRVAIIDSNHR